jgi:creatinine amidohydrolase
VESLSIERITQPAAEALLAESRTVVLATGSIEQHGAHLPLGTDAFAAQVIAERVARRLRSLFVPLPLVGVAPYHLPWPGSLSLRPDTLRAVIVDICSGLARAGAERIVIVNWHEGNTPTLRLAADDVQRHDPVRVIIAEGHIITNGQFPDEMEFTHAGSMETAAVLAYDPTLVQTDETTDASDYDASADGHELFRQRDVYPILTDFREIADSGWYGHPETVTAARASEIIDHVADYIVDRVETIWSELQKRSVSVDQSARVIR